MKNFLYILVAVIVIGVAGYFMFRGKSTPTSSSSGDSENQSVSQEGTKIVSGDIVMDGAVATIYYGDGCPHCTNIEKWLQDNNYLPSGDSVDQSKVNSWISKAKVKFNLKEVWKNKQNSAELSSKAAALGIAENQVGVPFLYDISNNKSFAGETDIKKFFQSQ